MPELPEVETVVCSLRPFILGKTITKVSVLHPKSFLSQQRLKFVINAKIKNVHRRAKLIIIDLSNKYSLVFHLKMTGQLLYKSHHQLAGGGHPTADILNQLPGKHTRLIFTLSDDDQLFFNDLRIFGWAKVFSAPELKQELAKYGPDAHQAHSWEYLQKCFTKRSVSIKQVLMDPQVVAGIGNIYASEILFAAGISPIRSAKSLTSKEIKTIARITPSILLAAINARGTTFDGRYIDAQGKTGGFVSQLKVYGRANLPCLRCGQNLQSCKIGGRNSVYCPKCQR